MPTAPLEEAGGGSSAPPMALVVGLAVALPLGCAGATACGLAWQRRRQRQRRLDQSRRDLDSLLGARQRRQSSSCGVGQDAAAAGSQQGLGPELEAGDLEAGQCTPPHSPAGRRVQLAALMAGRMGPGLCSSLEALAEEALPAALAHHLQASGAPAQRKRERRRRGKQPAGSGGSGTDAQLGKPHTSHQPSPPPPTPTKTGLAGEHGEP